MNSTSLLFEEKKRALGLSTVSKAAVGLAALLPAVALATPAPTSGVFTPTSPILFSGRSAYWNPYTNDGGTDWMNLSTYVSLGTCSSNLYGSYNYNGACNAGVTVTWATPVCTAGLTQFSPGDTIDGSLNFGGSPFAYSFSMADGTDTYFAYRIYDGSDYSYGWVDLNYTAADGYAITQWGTNFRDSITIPATTPVPEPSTYALVFGLAFAGLALVKRWQKRATLTA